MTRVVVVFIFLFVAQMAMASENTALFVSKISKHIAKVYVSSPRGFGLGSGVVIAHDKVVTNCHVVANASSVNVQVNGEYFQASGLIPDWHHDVCILVVSGLTTPVANLGNSHHLLYEQPLYSIGFAGGSPKANATFGFVKGLYPMDDSVVIRASNTFRLGDSGGGVFDETGDLVAIIAVKSPGRTPNYYNMSVAWVKALMRQPMQKLTAKSELPFWAEAPEKWPYFMRIVQPFKTNDWDALSRIAAEWAVAEPNTLEASYYQGVAAFNLHQVKLAQVHLNRVISVNKLHVDAVYYLGVIAEQNGQHEEAMEMLTLLEDIDETTAENLREYIQLAKLD
jgi:hypothetical protein